MHYYNIHTHKRRDEEISILNIYPMEFEENLDGSFSCGVHPWYSDDYDAQLDVLSSIVRNQNVIAVGEAGYDSLKGASLDVQQKVFERQIELSEDCQKPMIIHCVKAWDYLLKSHKKYEPKQAWIVHGYRGGVEQMKQLLARGIMFSVGAYFNHDFIKQVPLESLFLETDDSDTLIQDIYSSVADIRGVSLETLVETVESNVKRVFFLSMSI